MKQKPIWSDLNPKAVTTDELFGFIHHATREWKDGKYYFPFDALKMSFSLSPFRNLSFGINHSHTHRFGSWSQFNYVLIQSKV